MNLWKSGVSMMNQFKVRVWAVIGEGSTGKSTVIGHLTSKLGRGPGGPQFMLLRGGGYLRVHARRQSLQEARITAQSIVRTFKARIANLQKNKGLSIGYANLLVAIRTDKINGLPPATDYLSYFVTSGWDLESIVILDYDGRKHASYHEFGVPTLEVYNSSDWVQDKLQHQILVGQVRNHFGWA
jgi:hypothetical protein